MTDSEAIAYIENYTWSTTRLGLERTKALLAALGEPQKKLRFIHVAGSNGKGSTCAMLDAVLRKAGYTVGLYTSPYIQRFHERIQVNGESISGPALAALTERVRDIADGMEDHPSQFELVTAVAFEYFLERHCDIVILEVGMGGALDSTNVIDAPEVAVITNIGLEHTEYLGNTLAEIASAKAGIIKTGCVCVCYDIPQEAAAVVETVCQQRDVPLRRIDLSHLRPLTRDLDGQTFIWKGKRFVLSLLGAHQLHNAAVVLETIQALAGRGWKIPDEAIAAGLWEVKWPARLEILCREPLFILDGGHNPQCAQALGASLKALLPGQKFVFLMGMLADKNLTGIVDRLLPLGAAFICVTPPSPRALSGEALAAYLRGRGAKAVVSETVEAGIQAALSFPDKNDAVVSFGSLYLAGAVRTAFPSALQKWLRTDRIRRRDALADTRREEYSARIAERLQALEEYRRAKHILIYRAVHGEVTLDRLGQDGRFAYPVCVGNGQMIALHPEGDDAWQRGSFGIMEPVPERSTLISPEELDLVICPCTVFDEDCRRIGMGGGYYDRYLPQCTRARIVAVAFETQKAAGIPAESWDFAMDEIITEQSVYRRR